MILNRKTYKKLCKKCHKRIKHSRTSPSSPPLKNHQMKSNEITSNVCGDFRVLAQKYFQKLLSKNKQGKTRKNVPWTKLSRVLILQQQCLIKWPVNFPFCGGIKILKLLAAECKQLLTMKIENWNTS